MKTDRQIVDEARALLKKRMINNDRINEEYPRKEQSGYVLNTAADCILADFERVLAG